MKPATQKILGWAGLAFGVAGILVLVLIFAAVGPPPNWIYWLWPVVAAATTLVSARTLQNAYRRQPSQGKGFYHLRLSELLVVVLSVALMSLAGHAIWEEEGVPTVVSLSIAAGMLLALGFMVAERNQLTVWRRYCFSIGLPILVFAALSTAALIALGACGLPFWLVREEIRCCLVPVFLADLFAAPVGAVLCWISLH
jgi:hypothetical protein